MDKPDYKKSGKSREKYLHVPLFVHFNAFYYYAKDQDDSLRAFLAALHIQHVMTPWTIPLWCFFSVDGPLKSIIRVASRFVFSSTRAYGYYMGERNVVLYSIVLWHSHQMNPSISSISAAPGLFLWSTINVKRNPCRCVTFLLISQRVLLLLLWLTIRRRWVEQLRWPLNYKLIITTAAAIISGGRKV